MWKTGIVRSEDLLGRSADRKGGRRFAFTLLADLQQAHLPTDEVLLESIYNQLVVGGHVHKTTHRGRFRELDRRLVDEVLQRFANVELVRLHDIGASSAITSLELFRAFENRHPVAVHASDFYAHLDFVVCAGSPWTIVFDADGRALQFVGKRQYAQEHQIVLCT